jgi:hypothetical protein
MKPVSKRARAPQRIVGGSIETLRKAALAHTDAACSLSARAGGGSVSAAYLAGVAVECMLKAYFLSRDRYLTLHDLKEKQPRIYARLFESKYGHDLNELSDLSRLSSMLPDAIGGPNHKKKRDGKPEPDACWQRMSRPAVRPYSVRYAEETLRQQEVTQEVERAKMIVDRLNLQTPRMKR